MHYYMALSTTAYSLGVALYFDRDTHHYHKNVPTYLGFTLLVCTHNTTNVGIQKYERHLRMLPSYIIIWNGVRFDLGLVIIITYFLVLLETKFILYR